jgi:hypothetical protein
VAIKAWNLLGGVIDWAGLPVVAALVGAENIELLIRHLVLIRDFNNDS